MHIIFYAILTYNDGFYDKSLDLNAKIIRTEPFAFFIKAGSIFFIEARRFFTKNSQNKNNTFGLVQKSKAGF